MSETTETKTVTSTKAKGEIGPSRIGREIKDGRESGRESVEIGVCAGTLKTKI